jgi:hypothetical protein
MRRVPGSIFNPSNSFSIRSAASLSRVEFPANRVDISVLKPDKEEDFRVFKRIITNPGIVFTSSWINQWFGLEKLREHCESFESLLEMASKGNPHVTMPEKFVKEYKRSRDEGMKDKELSEVAKKLALDEFFELRENDDKLSDIFKRLGRFASSDGLGYYKFLDKEDLDGTESKLLGGGALAPLCDSSPVNKVDIALHILRQGKGVGTTCLGVLLEEAFEKHPEVKEVWGSSIQDHPHTPTLCARMGMRIADEGGQKVYFMNRKMWEVVKEEKNFTPGVTASTYYGGGQGGQRR